MNKAIITVELNPLIRAVVPTGMREGWFLRGVANRQA